jgi:RNA-directed DNA polymerase
MLALSPVAETRRSNSYGFRIERSTADAMAQLFVSIPGFRLLGIGRRHRRVLRQHQPRLAVKECPYGCTDAPAMVKGRVIHKGSYMQRMQVRRKGIISPTLANLALDGLETLLKQY